jgi:hypothetical protein
MFVGSRADPTTRHFDAPLVGNGEDGIARRSPDRYLCPGVQGASRPRRGPSPPEERFDQRFATNEPPTPDASGPRAVLKEARHARS